MTSSISIKSVSFVGSGNVASHLARALSNVGVEICEVFSPTTENALVFSKKFKCNICPSLSSFNTEVDMIIISVPDSLINEVAEKINDKLFCVHTSGISGIEKLNSKTRHGVFYPLQTFSKSKELDMTKVPFCIEANNAEDTNMLLTLAERISNNVSEVSSVQRKVLHLTAVMVSNFSNHLYHLASDILEVNGLNFEFLKPLIIETAQKVDQIHPSEAQTGPARRNDLTTIDEHMEMLAKLPEYQEVYKIISKQILNKYHE